VAALKAARSPLQRNPKRNVTASDNEATRHLLSFLFWKMGKRGLFTEVQWPISEIESRDT
jgi:hypothetical protein